MESTRISLARVLELGVSVSWREATAIVHEAVAGTGATAGAGPEMVTAESCLLTRGGDVVLAGTAAQARPEAVVQLLDDLLASCSNPGRFSGAVADGTALEMIEELSQHTTPERRRVEVASVALRGLAAEAAAARAMADADEQHPSADFDDLIAAPTPAPSPIDVPWLSVTALAPPAAMPTIPDPIFALLDDSAVDNAEVRRPDLDHEDLIAADHEDLIAAVEVAPTPAAAPADVPWPWVAALAPPAAMPTILDQTFALLGDSDVGNAEIRRLGLDEVAAVALRGLAAEADAARAMAEADEQDPSADFDDCIAAPTPAASPTALPRPSVTALAPLSAKPTIQDQTFAPRGDSTCGNAEIRRPALDHEDLIAAIEVDREWTAPEDAVAPLAIGTSPASGTPPSVTLRPASVSMDLPSAKPLVIAVWASASAIAQAASASAIARAASALAIVRATSASAIVRAASALAIVQAASASAIVRAASALAIVRATSASAIVRATSASAIVRAASALAIVRAASALAIVRAASALTIVRAASALAIVRATSASIVRAASALAIVRAASTLAIARATSASAIVRAASALAIVRAASASAIVRAASALAIVRAASASAIVRATSASIVRATSASAIVRAASALAIARAASASAIARAASASAIVRVTSASGIVQAAYVRGGYPSPFDWVKRASPAALVWSVLAVAAGIQVLQVPATRRPAVEPSETTIVPPEIGAPVGLDGHTPLARPDPDLLPEVTDPPSVPPLVARSAPRGSRIAQASFVRSIPPPDGGPKPPARNTAAVAGSRSLSTTSAAAAVLAPDAANSAGTPPPAVDSLSVVASPSATGSSPAETSGFAATYVPVNAVARAPDRELEARAIQNVLGRYRIAFNNLDAGAALAVWPTVNEKTLAKAFEGLESHDMSFRSCQIEIFAVLAEAACSGSARYVPKVGSRTPKAEARRWTFSLRKASDGWLIDSVDAR